MPPSRGYSGEVWTHWRSEPERSSSWWGLRMKEMKRRGDELMGYMKVLGSIGNGCVYFRDGKSFL